MSDIKFDHLICLPFVHGSKDCFGLNRAFFKDVYDIVPNIARPDD
jgi:hypothetical protein